jgi:hypothetical protein
MGVPQINSITEPLAPYVKKNFFLLEELAKRIMLYSVEGAILTDAEGLGSNSRQ